MTIKTPLGDFADKLASAIIYEMRERGTSLILQPYAKRGEPPMIAIIAMKSEAEIANSFYPTTRHVMLQMSDKEDQEGWFMIDLHAENLSLEHDSIVPRMTVPDIESVIRSNVIGDIVNFFLGARSPVDDVPSAAVH